MSTSKTEKKTNSLQKIKSKYILQQIFNHFSIKYKLFIIKYNKKTQDRCGININDYIDYSNKNFPFEIVILRHQKYSGKIVNINNGQENNYKIYFNNNPKPYERNYIFEYEKYIKKIRILIRSNITSFKYLFLDCPVLKEVLIKKMYNNNITDMSCMFAYCKNLEAIYFDSANTENVTDMSNMFYNCFNLVHVDLSRINTTKVTFMKGMFYNCISLRVLFIDNFDISNTRNFNSMFQYCKNLDIITINGLHFKNKFDFTYNNMFYGCKPQLLDCRYEKINIIWYSYLNLDLICRSAIWNDNDILRERLENIL